MRVGREKLAASRHSILRFYNLNIIYMLILNVNEILRIVIRLVVAKRQKRVTAIATGCDLIPTRGSEIFIIFILSLWCQGKMRR